MHLASPTFSRRVVSTLLVVLSLLYFATVPASSQTVLINETFSGSGLPAGWQLIAGSSASVTGGQLSLSGCIKLPVTYSRSAGIRIEADITITDYFWFYIFGQGQQAQNCFPDFGYGLGHVIDVPQFPGAVYLFTHDGPSTSHSLGGANTTLIAGNTYHTRIDFSNTGKITAYFNRNFAFTTTNSDYNAGNIWLVSQATAHIDNLLITTDVLTAAPTNLAVQAASSGANSLTWSDNSNNETGYKIERKVGSGTYSEIATTGPNVDFFNDTGLSSSTQYCYRVRATNATDDSAYSNEACGTPVLQSPLHHFSFSSIASPRTAGTPFSVTVTARTSSGAIVQDNFDITVAASQGQVTPTQVRLQQGTATFAVTLDTNGSGISLSALGNGMTGQSNVFDVTGATALTGTLSGFVRTANGTGVSGATVLLSAGSSTDSRVTDSSGRFTFANKMCQAYNLSALTQEGLASSVSRAEVACGKTITADILMPGSTCNPSGLTPVLLVPGILGSAIPESEIYPELPSTPPSAWNDESVWGPWTWNPVAGQPSGLHDPFNHVGWRDLAKSLEGYDAHYSIGCTVFPVPWDWRMPLDNVVDKYLIPAIDFAKQRAGTAKVNIITHSMGGLLVRAYIEGGAYASRQDVSRFAMVGSPNLGSANAFLLWQGGDPVAADRIAGDQSYIYTVTSQLIFQRFLHRPTPFNRFLPEQAPLFYQDMAYIYHTKVPALLQLEPLWDVLQPNGALQCPARGNTQWTNAWLSNLNSSPNRSRMVPENGSSTSVRTKIFAGSGHDTIYKLPSGLRNCGNVFFPDGRPRATPEGRLADVVTLPGDGTVPLFSAYGGFSSDPGALGAQVSYDDSETGEHSTLLVAYKCKILSFITGASCSSFPQPATRDVSPPIESLAISVHGRPQFKVVAPNGSVSGINPTTGAVEAGIIGSLVTMHGEGGSVKFSDLGDGAYRIEISSSYQEDYGLEITYSADDGTSEGHSVTAFYSTPAIIKFNYNQTATPRISFDHNPVPPAGLEADLAGSLTRLLWQAPPDPLVTGYNVYSRLNTEPRFKKVGSTSTTVFNTADAWAGTAAQQVRLYAVSSIYADGSESFLANSVTNNDQDHDGVSDADEVLAGTRVDNPDTDGDGLTDGEERMRGGNPLLRDTDGDGVTDGQEVSNGSDLLDPTSIPGLYFFTVTPCRLLDTRGATGPMAGPALKNGAARLFPATGACGVPNTARALSVNVSVTGPTGDGYIKIYPGDVSAPLTSAINFSAGQTRSNNVIIPLSANTERTFAAYSFVAGAGEVHFILDVNGYYDVEP